MTEVATKTSTDQNLLGQTYEQIMKKVLGGDTPNFQLLSSPKDFNFAPAPTGQQNPQAYQLVSAMPNWSPVGSYTTEDATLYNAYRQVFSHVTFQVSPGQQESLKTAEANVTNTSNALVKAQSDMNQAYLTAKQNGGLVFAAQYPDIGSWISSGDGQAYIKNITDKRVAFESAQDFALQLQEATMPMTLKEAMAAIKRPTGDPASSTSPAGWTKVPDGSGILRWQPDFQIGTTGQDWRAQLSKGSQGAFSFNLSADQSNSSFNKSWAGGSSGYDSFFWGASGSGSWEKWELTKNSQDVKIEITVKSSTTVQVNPGQWYDGGFLSEIAKAGQGPTAQGFTITEPWQANGGAGSSSIFGQNGLVPARVAQLVVVYKPSFKITMANSTFSQFHEKFSASGGVRIGPFRFGGSGGSETNWTRSTSGGTCFEGGSTSEDPQIIGIVPAFPGVNTP
jgi:hypothetical protein